MNDAPPPLHPAVPPSSPPPPPYGQPPVYQPPVRKSGCGCTGLGCGLGCLFALIASVVAIVVLGIAAKGWIEKQVVSYTSYEAVALEAPQASPEQVSAALAKVEAFRASLAPGSEPRALEMTGEELNLVLWNDPTFAQIAGKAEVDIVGDQLNAKVGIPMDDLPLPEGWLADRLQGKYFNGELGLKLGMVAGRPALYLESLEVNGQVVPEMFMSGMRAQNLLEEAAKKPEFLATFERIEDIRMQDGRLIVVPKRQP